MSATVTPEAAFLLRRFAPRAASVALNPGLRVAAAVKHVAYTVHSRRKVALLEYLLKRKGSFRVSLTVAGGGLERCGAGWGPGRAPLCMVVCKLWMPAPARTTSSGGTGAPTLRTEDVNGRVSIEELDRIRPRGSSNAIHFDPFHLSSASLVVQDCQVLVFTRTRQRAARLAAVLGDRGVPAEAVHSGLTGTQRWRVVEAFKARAVRCLVATDVLGRGIDIPDLPVVVSYKLRGTKRRRS